MSSTLDEFLSSVLALIPGAWTIVVADKDGATLASASNTQPPTAIDAAFTSALSPAAEQASKLELGECHGASLEFATRRLVQLSIHPLCINIFGSSHMSFEAAHATHAVFLARLQPLQAEEMRQEQQQLQQQQAQPLQQPIEFQRSMHATT